MERIYNSSDLQIALKQKRQFLKVFFITLAILLAINVVVFIVYTKQEFKTPYRTPMIAFNILTCSIFGVVYLLLFTNKFHRINRYCILLKDMQTGIIAQGVNAFIRIDSTISAKDGVDFIKLVFLEWSEKEQEYFERNILFDVEKPIPDFKKGDMIKHDTYGNVLVAYEKVYNYDNI